jgi:hypothetical protein
MTMGSIFQPNRKGQHPQVKAHDGMTVAHSSDRMHICEHKNTHGYDGGKPPLPKHGSGVTPVHGQMHRIVNGKPVTGSGSFASYLDSVSGAVVPAGRNVATPGWGNATARSGNPMVHSPASKQLKPVAIHPNMTKGPAHAQALRDLGEAVLAQATRNK